MKKHLYLDPVGGIAGDMFVAAMLDAYPELKSSLLSMLTDFLPQYVIPSVSRGKRGGIAGISFKVDILQSEGSENQHIHYKDICEILSSSVLDRVTSSYARKIFFHLAEAESQVHGIAIEDVHFHEVADWDSITDIVASAWLIARVNDDIHWGCARLPLGHGRVKTAHGWLPIPAPATALLLKHFPVYDDQIDGERITPTGAAILKELMPEERLPTSTLSIRAIGYGLGSRELEGIPNMLRATLYEESIDSISIDHVVYFSFNIDDQTPEEMSYSLDQIRQCEGVLDVIQSHAYGKKGRLVFIIGVQALVDSEDAVLREIFMQTSTIGVRREIVSRSVLVRYQQNVDVEGTKIGVKTVMRPDGKHTTKAESDDLVIDGLGERRRLRNMAEDSIVVDRLSDE